MVLFGDLLFVCCLLFDVGFLLVCGLLCLMFCVLFVVVVFVACLLMVDDCWCLLLWCLWLFCFGLKSRVSFVVCCMLFDVVLVCCVWCCDSSLVFIMYCFALLVSCFEYWSWFLMCGLWFVACGVSFIVWYV